MFSIFFWLIRMAETLVLPSRCHLDSKVDSSRASVPPRGPEEDGKASEPVAQGESQHLSITRGSVQPQRLPPRCSCLAWSAPSRSL